MCPRGAQLLCGWRQLNGAVPEPKVAAGLWLWERRGQAQLGSHTAPIPFKPWARLPSSSTLQHRQGMAGKAGRGMPESSGL